jgi:hypothetical protein
MKNNASSRCPSCGTEVPADQLACPICGKSLLDADGPSPAPAHARAAYKARPFGQLMNGKLPAVIGGCLISVAFFAGVIFNVASAAPAETPAPTPEPVEIVAPPPTPSPTPTVNSIRLFAFGRELGDDGFTAYVGDRPFTLSIVTEPEVRKPLVSWAVTDSHGDGDSAAFSVSDDGLSCEFSALKPTGRNDLTVRCYGAELVIPVFLWER